MNLFFSSEDFLKFIEWDIKIYPCKIERNASGNKTPPLFPKDGLLVNEWKWWAEAPQISVQLLEEYQSKGFGFACVLPKDIAVVDCDDRYSYSAIHSMLCNLSIQPVKERSLSWTEKNQKHHFYFKTDTKLLNSQKLSDFGINGTGELFGAGRLIYLNQEGWVKPPFEFKELPELPDLFKRKLVSKNNQIEGIHSSSGLIKNGYRDNTLFKTACSLKNFGYSKESSFQALRVLYRFGCEPSPEISESTLRAKVNSAYKYSKNNGPPSKDKFRFSTKYIRNLKKESGNE